MVDRKLQRDRPAGTGALQEHGLTEITLDRDERAGGMTTPRAARGHRAGITFISVTNVERRRPGWRICG